MYVYRHIYVDTIQVSLKYRSDRATFSRKRRRLEASETVDSPWHDTAVPDI